MNENELAALIDQTPELLNEFYVWQITSNVLVIILVFVFHLLIYQCRFLISSKDDFDNSTKIGERYYDPDGMPFYAYWIILWLSLITFLVVLITNMYNLLHLLIAPKIYIIEYFLR